MRANLEAKKIMQNKFILIQTMSTSQMTSFECGRAQFLYAKYDLIKCYFP